MFEIIDTKSDIIKIIGIGDCGLNSVQHIMSSHRIEDVEFIHIDTKNQGNIIANIKDADFLFIIIGGDSTGVAFAVAKLAREMDIFTIAIIIKPNINENVDFAKTGINQLVQHTNSVITISKETNHLTPAESVNDIILQIIKSIADPITQPGLTCFSADDLKVVMSKRGEIRVSIGQGTGKDRASLAVEAAIVKPWLNGNTLSNASGIFINIATAPSLTNSISIVEFDTVGNAIRDHVPDETIVVIGMSFDPNLINDVFRVVIFATGVC